MHKRSALALAVGALMATSPGAEATNWGGADGSWFQGSNWVGGTLPGVNGDAVFQSGGIARIDTGAAAGVYNAYIGNNGGTQGTVSISNGSLSVRNTVRVGVVGFGKLTIQGANASLSQTGGTFWLAAFDPGSGGTSTGTLILSNGAHLDSTPSEFLIGRVGTGTMTVTDPGSLAHVEQDVYIGYQGSGRLDVTNGGLFEANNFRSQAGAKGSALNVDGGILRLLAGTNELFADMPAGSIQAGSGGMRIATKDFIVKTAANAPGIEGTGGLRKTGNGILILTNENTYTGGTTISEGTLQIGDGGTSGSIVGDVTVVQGGGTNLVFYRGDDVTFAGSISGAGTVQKQGAGTMRLTGNSPSTGDLLVGQGTLDMSGTTKMNGVITSNGTLIGTGTLGSVNNSGLVAPGNSIGTLTVSGDYRQSSNGTLAIEIAPDGSGNDLLAVGGTTSLDGTLTATGDKGAKLKPGAGGPTGTKRYTVLTAGGGVNGRFATEPGPLGAFTFDTIYNPDNVQLGVTYTGFTPVVAPGTGTVPGTAPGTSNQVSKATGLDRVPIDPVSGNYNSGNADFDNVLTELANTPAAQLGPTLDSLAAEPYAAFMTVLLEQNDFYAETVLERAQLCSARGRGSLAGGYNPQQAAGGEPIGEGCPNHERHGVWLDATWLQGNIDGEGDLSGYDYRLSGGVLGADTAVGSDATLGGAFGFGQPKLDNYDLADAEIDGDSYFLSAYGTLTRNRWEFFGMLGYTWGNYDSERQIRAGDISRTAKGDFDGDGFIASAKAAYDYPVQGFDLIPEIGITYSKIWQDGFTEKGADSLNLKVDDADAHSLITSIGVRLGTAFRAGDADIRPQALLRYDYDWNADDNDAHETDSSFAAVPTVGNIDIVGQNRGEHGLLLAGGVTAQINERANLFAGGGYRWNSNGEEYNFGLGARMTW